MGHTEMSLAVAGLQQQQVQSMTRRLAGDWSDFSGAQRAAFEFARKQARQPAAIQDADLAELRRHFGDGGAWQVVWWSSRCHYMTKVADAFQLPLEQGNPFMDNVKARQQRAAAKK